MGLAQSALNINIQNALSAPEISGSVIERFGRGVQLQEFFTNGKRLTKLQFIMAWLMQDR